MDQSLIVNIFLMKSLMVQLFKLAFSIFKLIYSLLEIVELECQRRDFLLAL